MSVRAMAWAWKQQAPSASAKFVLLALADHAGEDLHCWPSTGLLAEKCSLDARTVRRHMTALQEAGLIEKVRRRHRPDGSLSTWLVRLIEHPDLADRFDQWSDPTSGQIVHPYRTSTTVLADTDVRAEPSRTINEPSVSRVASVADGGSRSGVEVIDGHGTVPAVQPDPDVDRLCDQLADAIEARGSKRPSITAAWRTEIDRLIRIDGRTPHEIENVIAWLSAGRDEVAQFWAPNVRSPQKLRSKWDTMREQLQREQKKPTSASKFTDPSAAAGVRALQRAAQMKQQKENAS